MHFCLSPAIYVLNFTSVHVIVLKLYAGKKFKREDFPTLGQVHCTSAQVLGQSASEQQSYGPDKGWTPPA